MYHYVEMLVSLPSKEALQRSSKEKKEILKDITLMLAYKQNTLQV